MDDTIAAISTPVGQGAIAILRLSGPAALSVLGKVFRGGAGALNPVPRQVYFGEVHDGAARVDLALATYFRAPNSYTGEDLVEISCHGGILVSRKILNLLFQSGARPANPGEFTLRAFLNGKMDLTQAEAVMDLIHAQTELALRAANEQLAGHLGKELDRLRESLLFFEGRVDEQIKLSGYRIELGDVEANLRALQTVRDAVVIPMIKSGTAQSLTAFVSLTARNETSDFKLAHNLRSQLGQRLPMYMLPRKFVFLDAFPMTANGKVDRIALAKSL